MARVTFTITDTEDGAVDLKIESEPAFPAPAATDEAPRDTTAQLLAGIAFAAITEATNLNA